MTRKLLIATALTAMIAPTTADAGCKLANLSGTWSVFVMGQATEGDLNVGEGPIIPFVFECAAHANSKGVLRNGSRCGDGEPFAVAGMKVRAGCAVTGTFIFQSWPLDRSPGSLDPDRLRCNISGAFTGNKQLLAGLGICSEGSHFSFQMVRR